MQLILDNIVAAMVAGAILLIITVGMHENQQAQVAATNYYALKSAAYGFIDILERDLQNADSVLTVGMNLNDPSAAFAFYSQFDSTTTTSFCVRYELIETETRSTPEGSVQLYKVQRYQGPPPPADCLTDPGVESSGASPGIIREWSITPLNESDQSVTESNKLGASRSVKVHFAFGSPFKVESESDVKETSWTRTFRPRLMRSGGAIYL